jgi:hypothetical protein
MIRYRRAELMWIYRDINESISTTMRSMSQTQRGHVTSLRSCHIIEVMSHHSIDKRAEDDLCELLPGFRQLSGPMCDLATRQQKLETLPSTIKQIQVRLSSRSVGTRKLLLNFRVRRLSQRRSSPAHCAL